MPGTKPLIELVKVPEPVLSVVLEFDVVGFWVVAQQTPLAVTGEPPSLDIFPPLLAELVEITDKSVVVNAGATANVDKIT